MCKVITPKEKKNKKKKTHLSKYRTSVIRHRVQSLPSFSAPAFKDHYKGSGRMFVAAPA